MKIFLMEHMNVREEDFRCSVQINMVHKKRMKKILNFWSTYLDVDSSQFTKPYYVKVVPKKIYDNFDSYYGILRLRVLRSSELQYKMLGLMSTLPG